MGAGTLRGQRRARRAAVHRSSFLHDFEMTHDASHAKNRAIPLNFSFATALTSGTGKHPQARVSDPPARGAHAASDAQGTADSTGGAR